MNNTDKINIRDWQKKSKLKEEDQSMSISSSLCYNSNGLHSDHTATGPSRKRNNVLPQYGRSIHIDDFNSATTSLNSTEV